MPSHPTRWGLVALVSLLLITFAAPTAFARISKVELYEEYEGDPGDGVLDPSAIASGWSPSPVYDVVSAGSATTSAWTVPVLPFAPMLMLPGGASVPVLLFLNDDASGAVMRSALVPAGRWHDAR